MDLSNVTQLTIGFERTGVSGGSGTVFIDDILLYRLAPSVASEETWIEAEAAGIKLSKNCPKRSEQKMTIIFDCFRLLTGQDHINLNFLEEHYV